MIPIRFRLSDDEKLEYIERIIKCFNPRERIKYSYQIMSLLMWMERKGYTGYNDLQQEAIIYRRTYPHCAYLCMWLVLDYEKIDNLREFIRNNFIENDIRKLSCFMKHHGKEEINSYSELERRRKNEYPNNLIIIKTLKFAICYDTIYNRFSKFKEIYTSEFSKRNINNWIIEKTQVKVCPYCNLAYTYSRGKMTTAQLDHFFSKAEYPMFSLCFYNLIPSCPACNHIKSDKQNKFVSPYKENAFGDLKISWEYNSSRGGRFNCNSRTRLTDLEKDIKIILETSCIEEKNNIEFMNIEEAYNQHKDYAAEIIKKVRIFSNRNTKKLIVAMAKDVGIKSYEVERFYLGNYVEDEQLENRILSKLTSDFYKEYKEYVKSSGK